MQGYLRRARGDHRRMPLHLQRARGEAVRHSRIRHARAQLGHEFPLRIRGVQGVCEMFPGRLPASRGYLRYAAKAVCQTRFAVFDELRAAGHEPKGIRLDSGDLAYLSKRARAMLDEAGLSRTRSSALPAIWTNTSSSSLKAQGAKIDLVGSRHQTDHQRGYARASGGVYKLSALYPRERR